MTATYKSWVAGDVLNAADVMSYLMKQVNIKHTNTGDRPASPAEGWRGMLTGLDREDTYDGTNWIRTGWWGSAGRTGGLWRRTSTQAIAATTNTYISWDTEDQDTDGILAHHATTGTTVTFATGLGGLAIVHANTIFDNDPGASAMWLEWSISGAPVITQTEAGSAARPGDGADFHLGLVGFKVVSPGDTLKVAIRDAAGEDVIGGNLDVFIIGK